MKSRVIDHCMLELQYLKELEEIIEYKTADDESRKKHLKEIWRNRLQFMVQDIGPIQKVLNLRSLVIDTSEDTAHYLELADLCTKKGNAPMCQRILQNLRTEITNNVNQGQKDQLFNLSQVDFGMLKYEYSQGDQNKALEGLKFLIENEEKIDPLWYITLGKWNKEMREREKNLNDEEFRKIISYFKKATELDETDNLAWHHYALANYEACKHFESFASPSKMGNHHLVTEYVLYVMFAVKGLIQSISLGGQDVTKTLQDTLRLLKLWFKHGSVEEIDNQVKNGFDIIGVEVWTQVIPQLLARIDINAAKVKKTMVHLLKIICDTYPQAMIYPVSVLSQSNTDNKKQVADELIEIMRKNQKELINQALFISKELVRAAVLMNESWCEALEEAASNYFASNNSEKMIEILEKQYKTLEDEPQSMSEIAFHQIYKCELLEAWDWINKPNRTDDDFLMAWDIYHKLFLRLSKKLKEVDFYELKNIAPKLLEIESSTISVPGLYRCNQNIISIYKFAPSLTVLKSKQLPRKISMYGSDGKEYGFLLKGREDIRQDERAMQLFGLVNTLLSVDPVTQRKDLSIKRYSIIPLSFNAGLLGWVPNSDTLNQLITKYREAKEVIPRIELMMIEKTCKHFEDCPKINKVEIFESILEKTVGEDLQKMLWIQSSSSENWLERRTNFTRSLAVMSMVGYILGLGDRHPSNIMLDRFSGKVVHIDFGDCFEIAMRRDKFPEQIPFRLTRMLIKTMEISGIEGNYRITCENTMRVLRQSRDSLMAILEAFVYDPLISFKLLAQNLLKNSPPESKTKPIPLSKTNHDALENQIKHSIVSNVLHNANFGNNLATTKLTDIKQSIALQSMLEEPVGVEVIKQEEEILNETAEVVVSRIASKLRGTDYSDDPLTVEQQVDKLIKEATNHENLANGYIGWCPFF